MGFLHGTRKSEFKRSFSLPEQHSLISCHKKYIEKRAIGSEERFQEYELLTYVFPGRIERLKTFSSAIKMSNVDQIPLQYFQAEGESELKSFQMPNVNHFTTEYCISTMTTSL